MQPDPKPPKDDAAPPRHEVQEPDEHTNPAENIEEEGEPFFGNFA